VLSLADGEAGQARFRLRTGSVPGAATLRVTARAGELSSTDQARLPVLSAAPRVRRVQRLELEAGVTDLRPYLLGWVPHTERSTFWVTRNPYGDVFDHLKFLVRYPFGCIEQTVSTTRPLLHLPELLGSIDPELLEHRTVEQLALHGIERIFTMQNPAGGFAYWPGGGEAVPWASAYATHLLLDARELRYPIDPGRLEEALHWLEREIAGTARGSRPADPYARNAEPYLHYVLARAGRAQKGRILRLVEEAGPAPRYEEREQLYLLKAALWLAGDHRFERDLRVPDLSPVADYRDNGWSFYSDRRMRGLMLAVHADLFGRTPAGDRLADLVAEGLRGRPSGAFTTQELVWGITGLGKYLESGTWEHATPILLASGRAAPPEPLPPGSASRDRTWSLYRASEQPELTLDVPSKGEGKLYLVLSSEGVPTSGSARYGGEGLELTRRLLDAAGEPLDLAAPLPLGALVYVELTLRNTSPERIANVALVDRIAAGWEIENPRLGRERAVEWLDPESVWEADHLELRDDRLEVFGQLERGQSRKVLYLARAVSAGRFALPSAEAEAMYDPRIWARVRGGEVEVVGPWE
jgi:alpha-2-macroglobulin